jgi:hypothetical protein
MGSVSYTIAGRTDGDGVRHVEQFPEAIQVGSAAPALDAYEYEPFPNRCVFIKPDGARCKGKRLPGRSMCMVHWRDDESE